MFSLLLLCVRSSFFPSEQLKIRFVVVRKTQKIIIEVSLSLFDLRSFDNIFPHNTHSLLHITK